MFLEKFIAEIKARGIAWFACATTLAEARAAQAAGADAIVAQGSEAGGHCGPFDAVAAERQSIGLFALVRAAGEQIVGTDHRGRRDW
jgi:nitronate monooxygenase